MPSPSNRHAFGSADDFAVLSLAVIIVGCGFGGWMLWRNAHGAISAAALAVAHRQMQVIALFTDRFALADAQVQAADPETVTFSQLTGLFRDIGRFFRIPAAMLVSSLGVLCFLRAAPARFCRALDLDGLIREQARSFRFIAAFVSRRLRLAPIGPGEPRPCEPALHVREWVARCATAKDGRFDETRARTELRRQLGGLWRGLDHAEAPVRCMLAVSALHAAQKREEAIRLLGDLAESLSLEPQEGRSGPAKPLAFPAAVVTQADYWLAQDEVGPPALALAARHGFATPALMSVLTYARLRGGVLAPAQFAFLKLVDRRLWYALHSLGFPADAPGQQPHPNPRVEAIGARDHWAAELAVGARLVAPAIDRAVAVIRAAADDAEVRPNPREFV